MRKELKIKAIIIFLAWGVVFLHGVIPHNHIQDLQGHCSSVIHESDEIAKSDTHSDHLRGIHSEKEKVCHFSAVLFQQGYDEIITFIPQLSQIIPVEDVIFPLSGDTDNLRSTADISPSHLRAPPLA